jgi:uncharacterized membrane protein YuzA (DUF378 family)
MENKIFYNKVSFHMFLILIVIIGAINWGTTAMGYNLVEMLSQFVNKLFNSNISFDKIIYLIVMAAAIYLSTKKETWLPFLGNSVLPNILVPLKTPSNTNKTIEVMTQPNSKVAYWAALPLGKAPDVETAYGDYSNSGVVMSDSKGIAKLPILEGSGYIVPNGRMISRHIHYRVLGLPYGMIGKVKTIYY